MDQSGSRCMRMTHPKRFSIVSYKHRQEPIRLSKLSEVFKNCCYKSDKRFLDFSWAMWYNEKDCLHVIYHNFDWSVCKVSSLLQEVDSVVINLSCMVVEK